MAKIITIGRGDEADISIDNDLVSRRHATLRLLPFGKMELRDLSKNGTFINGIRMSFNKPYPVTRKDVISFARASQLDWNRIPDTMQPYRIGGGIFIAVVIIIVFFIVFVSISNSDDLNESDNEDALPATENVLEAVPKTTPPSTTQETEEITVPDKYPNLFPEKRDKNKKEPAEPKQDKSEKTEEEGGSKSSQQEKSEKEGNNGTINWMTN